LQRQPQQSVGQRQQTRMSHNNQEQQQFYPRIVNRTDIKFTEEELGLLNNGLEYSIEKPPETYFTDLVVETERAIKLLDRKSQDSFRNSAANILKLINSSNSHNNLQEEQLYIVEQIERKLVTENAILVHADNGKTVVIINSDEYSEKVETFLAAKKFSILDRDPTGKYQKHIRKTMR